MKQSQIADQLGYSTNFVKHYRNDINKLSPYRIQATGTNKQKKALKISFNNNSHHDPEVKDLV